MKCFVARIKSFLQVEYSWKEFNTQWEETVMKKFKVGNTEFVSLELVDRLWLSRALSNVYIQVWRHISRKDPPCLFQCLIKATLESCTY